MFGNFISKLRKASAPLALGVLLAGAAASQWGCGAKQDASAQGTDNAVPLAARVDRLDGDVGIARQSDSPDNNQNSNQNSNQSSSPNVGQTQADTNWAKAGVNAPVSTGSRVYVKQGSHAAIAFSGRNYARLNPNTSLDVLSLSQRRTQLALREGSGVFDVGALAPGELFEVATPGGAVDFDKPGLYQVGIGDDGGTLLTVLAGSAQVVGLAGSGRCSQGQLLTFGASDGQDGQEDAYLSDVDPGVSGNIVNDYYSYRYPQTYDGRYRDYKRYQDDPYYYDPYRRSASYQYVPDDSEVAGLYDLDDNGDWEDVPGHGHCWRPRVSSGWAPYRDGSWYDDQRLGLTWVSNESWGWAPYHYGRWTNASRGWFWEPGEIVTRPIYAPALVAFVPFPQEDRIGWVALGPGDPYVPRYYDRNYQPQYVGSTNVTNIVTYNNYNVAGAVTVVRTTEFTRGVTPGTALIADPAMLARTRPVADPYSVPRVREIAPGMQAGRAAIQVPVAAQQVMARSVVTSQNPTGQPVASNSGKVQNAQTVPEAQSKRQLRINNSGPPVTAIQANGLPASDRQQQKAERKAAAQQGQQPATAQQQPATTQQQQKAERKAAAQQGQQPATAQQQPATTQQQQKAERKAAAQQGQQPATAQQQPATTQQQQKAERKAAAQQGRQPAAAQQQQQTTKQQQKAERKAAAQQGQQPATAQQRPATTQQQQKAERKAAAQQQGQQPAAAQQQQQQQQQKAERKAAAQQQGQQPAAAQQQQQQQQQQQKAARKAAAQQQGQQPAAAQQQQQQQQKAERKAAAQQQPAQATPSKAERQAEKAKNKNSNSGQ
jgi:hypothetical protein